MAVVPIVGGSDPKTLFSLYGQNLEKICNVYFSYESIRAYLFLHNLQLANCANH